MTPIFPLLNEGLKSLSGIIAYPALGNLTALTELNLNNHLAEMDQDGVDAVGKRTGLITLTIMNANAISDLKNLQRIELFNSEPILGQFFKIMGDLKSLQVIEISSANSFTLCPHQLQLPNLVSFLAYGISCKGFDQLDLPNLRCLAFESFDETLSKCINLRELCLHCEHDIASIPTKYRILPPQEPSQKRKFVLS